MKKDEMLKNLQEVSQMMTISDFLSDLTKDYLINRQMAIDAFKLKGLSDDKIDKVLEMVQDGCAKAFQKAYENGLKEDAEYSEAVHELANINTNAKVIFV